MKLVVNVLGILLIAVSVLSALGEFAKVPSVVQTMTRLHVRNQVLPILGGIKIALAILVVIGFSQSIVAVIAGILLSVYFAGAVIAHTRVKDSFSESAAAFVLLVASLTYVLTALAV